MPVAVCSPKMLPKRRSASESTRARCEMISIGTISGNSHHTGPTNCLAYLTGPCRRRPTML